MSNSKPTARAMSKIYEKSTVPLEEALTAIQEAANRGRDSVRVYLNASAEKEIRALGYLLCGNIGDFLVCWSPHSLGLAARENSND